MKELEIKILKIIKDQLEAWNIRKYVSINEDYSIFEQDLARKIIKAIIINAIEKS